MRLKHKINHNCWEEKFSYTHGKFYYINIEKGETQWSIPSEIISLPKDWEVYMSETISPGDFYYKHKYSKIIQWDKPIGFPEQEKPTPPGWEKRLSRCKNNYYVNNKTNQSHWYISKPIEVETKIIDSAPRGLEWTGQSCYLDSTLFALFAGDRGHDDFVTNILNMNVDTIESETNCSLTLIQKELKLISDSIKRVKGAPIVKKCTKLRKALVNCERASIYMKGLQADSGEFISYLISLFQINKI